MQYAKDELIHVPGLFDIICTAPAECGFQVTPGPVTDKRNGVDKAGILPCILLDKRDRQHRDIDRIVVPGRIRIEKRESGTSLLIDAKFFPEQMRIRKNEYMY